MTEERWRIELLGGLQSRRGDQVLSGLQQQQPALLLAYLAYHCPAPRSRDLLVELLWPEADPDTGRHNLRSVLHALRRILEPPDTPPGSVLVADSTTVRLHPAALTTDVAEFRAALADAARAESPQARAASLAAAVALYQGDLLPGFYDPWVLTERPPLAEAYLAALGQLAVEREQAGDLEGALEVARQAIRADPLREEAHYDVMRLYAAAGQPRSVLRQYQELERVLQEELGETPSAEARALAEELRQSARTLVVARRPPPRADERPTTDDERRTTDDERPTTDDGRPTTNVGPDSLVVGRSSLVGKLPAQLTRFYGREEEIARLTELLASSVPRLVTVTGPGGSGKTRLAIAAVGRLVEAPPDLSSTPKAVVFVALADVTDAARIPEAIADALGIERSPEVEVVDQVVGQLAARPWLLVLDNYEHLVEEGALWVRTLLERVPTLTCMVTSRQRLGITGEQEFALLPLPTPRRGTALEQLGEYASVQLFVDRARAVRDDFALTPENAASVAELCDRLDGLPLALELAAARIAVLLPQEMLGQLDRRFAFLVTRHRDTPTRHRTLRAVIEGSYELLDDRLQRFFARLSVFRGGWTLEAAEAVCADDQRPSTNDQQDGSHVGRSSLVVGRDAVLGYLEQLRDCSLLMVEVTKGSFGRYRLLETLREYAWEQLAASGEHAEIRRRHRDWYLQLAEQADAAARGPEQKSHLALLMAEIDNLRAALAWCQETADANPSSEVAAAEAGLRLADALYWLWIQSGYLAEGAKWLEGALIYGSHVPASVRARALVRAAYLARHRGTPERSISLLQSGRQGYEEVLTRARTEGDRMSTAVVIVALAEVAREMGDVDASWSYGVEARQRMAELGDRVGLARSLEVLSAVAPARGDLQAARPLLEERLALCRELGASDFLIHALGGMGHLERDEGNYARARSLYQESLILRREVGDQFALAQSLEDLAVLAGRERQAERAIRLLGAGEAFCETLGARPPVAVVSEYERAVAEGRAALGEAGFAEKWAEGRALSLEQAVAFALETSEV